MIDAINDTNTKIFIHHENNHIPKNSIFYLFNDDYNGYNSNINTDNIDLDVL